MEHMCVVGPPTLSDRFGKIFCQYANVQYYTFIPYNLTLVSTILIKKFTTAAHFNL